MIGDLWYRFWHCIGFHLGRLSNHRKTVVAKSADGVMLVLGVYLENAFLFWAVMCAAHAIHDWSKPSIQGFLWLSFIAYFVMLWFNRRQERRYMEQISSLQDRLIASLKREMALLRELGKKS